MTQNFDRHSIVLSCRRFSANNSYDRIADMLADVNFQFNIRVEKITGNATDNGGNLLKAFHLFGIHSISDCNDNLENDDDNEDITYT